MKAPPLLFHFSDSITTSQHHNITTLRCQHNSLLLDREKVYLKKDKDNGKDEKEAKVE